MTPSELLDALLAAAAAGDRKAAAFLPMFRDFLAGRGRASLLADECLERVLLAVRG